MKKFKVFMWNTLFGGMVVVLPAAITFTVFNWIFQFVIKQLEPIRNMIPLGANTHDMILNLLAILVIILGCFIVGLIVRTQMGKSILKQIEKSVIMRIPLYKIIKETVNQFLGRTQTPFSKVALVDVFSNQTRMTAFITEEHEDGSYTVFVPTGPNPTSGLIYHLAAEQVEILNVPIEDTMRTIIACGSGSSRLMNAVG